MEFLTDWKFWAFVISALTFIGVTISGIVNKLSTDKIANNHLTHIAEDIKKVITKQEEQGKEISQIKTEVSYIKGKQETESKLVEVLKETLKK